MIKIRKNNDSLIFIITVALFSSFYIYYMDSSGSIIMAGLTLVLAFLYLLKYRSLTIHITAYHKAVVLFAMFCFLSSIWAWVPNSAIEKGVTIVEILICMSVVYMCFIDKPIDVLFKVIMWGGNVVAIYTLFRFGASNVFNVLASGTRVAIEYANNNSVGVLMAYSLIISLYFFLFDGFHWWHIISIIPVIILAFLSSRTSLIDLLLGVIILLIFRFWDNRVESILKFLLVLSVAAILLFFVSKISIFSGLLARMGDLFNFFSKKGATIDGSALERSMFVKIGLDQFLRTPIGGIGIGNSYRLTSIYSNQGATYLHNNYVEILASGGIVGFLSYYGMHIYIIVTLLRNKEYWTKETIMCFTLILSVLLVDIGTVSYYRKDMYFLLMVIFICVDKMKKEYYYYE